MVREITYFILDLPARIKKERIKTRKTINFSILGEDQLKYNRVDKLTGKGDAGY